MKYKIWQTHEYNGHGKEPRLLKEPLDETENMYLAPDGKFIRVISLGDDGIALWEQNAKYFKLEIIKFE